jgi:RNA polymerase sigma-70 factor (ECF subfamily)
MQGGAAEAELLLKAARGDEAAFLLLYERHRTPVFRFACRMLGSSQLAEDVTQECFLSVLRRPEAFRAERAALRTYLCAIARHLVLKQLRKRGQETVMDDPPEETTGAVWTTAAADPLQSTMEVETASVVRRAVEALPPLQREAVVLFEYEEMSLADIASACEVDVGTVKSRLHRARERLRRALTPLLAGPPPKAAGAAAARRETRS